MSSGAEVETGGVTLQELHRVLMRVESRVEKLHEQLDAFVMSALPRCADHNARLEDVADRLGTAEAEVRRQSWLGKLAAAVAALVTAAAGIVALISGRGNTP